MTSMLAQKILTVIYITGFLLNNSLSLSSNVSRYENSSQKIIIKSKKLPSLFLDDENDLYLDIDSKNYTENRYRKTIVKTDKYYSQYSHSLKPGKSGINKNLTEHNNNNKSLTKKLIHKSENIITLPDDFPLLLKANTSVINIFTNSINILPNRLKREEKGTEIESPRTFNNHINNNTISKNENSFKNLINKLPYKSLIEINITPNFEYTSFNNKKNRNHELKYTLNSNPSLNATLKSKNDIINKISFEKKFINSLAEEQQKNKFKKDQLITNNKKTKINSRKKTNKISNFSINRIDFKKNLDSEKKKIIHGKKKIEKKIIKSFLNKKNYSKKNSNKNIKNHSSNATNLRRKKNALEKESEINDIQPNKKLESKEKRIIIHDPVVKKMNNNLSNASVENSKKLFPFFNAIKNKKRNKRHHSDNEIILKDTLLTNVFRNTHLRDVQKNIHKANRSKSEKSIMNKNSNLKNNNSHLQNKRFKKLAKQSKVRIYKYDNLKIKKSKYKTQTKKTFLKQNKQARKVPKINIKKTIQEIKRIPAKKAV